MPEATLTRWLPPCAVVLLGLVLGACSNEPPGPSVLRLGELVESPGSQGLLLSQGLTLAPQEPVSLNREVDASRLTHLEIRARGTARQLRLDWRLASEGRFKPYRSLSFPLRPSPREETYPVNLRREPYWTGEVAELRWTAVEGELEIAQVTAKASSSVYRDMALKGVSMPTVPGLERIEIPLPQKLPRRVTVETHLGVVPEYARPGVVVRFRASLDSDEKREVWLDRVVEASDEAAPWAEVRAAVVTRPGARLVLEAEASLHGRPLPEGTAQWGNPLLVTRRGKRAKNLLLIVVDTLRADVLGSYGSPLNLTPHLDALAADSVRLARLYAPAPWTLPSVASLMTGLTPQTHGAGQRIEGFAPTALPETSETLAEVLSRAGYFTTALYHNIYLSPAFGVHQGFDRYASHEERAELLVDRALEQLRAYRDRPLFLYLHLFDPHNPYEPPASDCPTDAPPVASKDPCRVDRRPGNPIPEASLWPWIEALYQAEVAYTDRQIGRLLAGLEELGLDDSTVVVVVSDHGEAFWRRLEQERSHGYSPDGDHGHTHYEELLHLVGLIRAPATPPATVRGAVEMADLYPTLLDLLGVDAPPNQGRSLARSGLGTPLPPTSLLADFLLYGPPRWALRQGRWKLIVRHDDVSDAELYDLHADPQETRNLIAHHPDVAHKMTVVGLEELARRDRAKEEFYRGQGSFTPAYLEWRHITKLRALGYLQ